MNLASSFLGYATSNAHTPTESTRWVHVKAVCKGPSPELAGHLIKAIEVFRIRHIRPFAGVLFDGRSSILAQDEQDPAARTILFCAYDLKEKLVTNPVDIEERTDRQLKWCPSTRVLFGIHSQGSAHENELHDI
ncbi:hypothetical protein BC628DRAFT_1423903 [Trametes gibbosa]|nr:hypothetical protein BC628DRAFT_1423903 [Trametes gibbosa]